MLHHWKEFLLLWWLSKPSVGDLHANGAGVFMFSVPQAQESTMCFCFAFLCAGVSGRKTF